MAGATQFAAPWIGHISTPHGRVVAAAAVGGTTARLGGGKFANGVATFGFLRLFAEVGAHATRVADALKRLACSSGGQACIDDERGVLRTDGARDIDWSLNRDHERNWFTRAGMNYEGDVHIYDNIPILRNLVIDTTKIHDWLNSWNYNPNTGFYMSRGTVFDSTFQLYSFAGMPVAALATVLGHAGNAPLGQVMIYNTIFKNSQRD